MKLRLTTLMAGLTMANIAMATTEIDLHKQPAAYIKNKLAAQSDASKMKIIQVRTDIDFKGTSHTRIQQTYNNIQVWDATGVIHTPNAQKKSRASLLSSIDNNTVMNGMIYEGIEKDLASVPVTTLTKTAQIKALQTAKAAHSKKFGLMAALGYKNEKAEPIIFIDDNKQAHYAYLTSFSYATATAVHRPTSIIDAATQKVYRSWEGILTAQKASSVNEAHAKFRAMLEGDDPAPADVYDITAGGIGGNTKMGEVVYDGAEGNAPGLKMKAMDFDIEMIPGNPYKVTLCSLTNEDITVVDISTGSSIVENVCIPNFKLHNNVAWLSMDKGQTRWSEDEMNGGYSPSLDAFNAAMTTKNLYQDWYGVPALIDENGNPMKYIMRVHFGRGYDNAFWDGEQMTFGDGHRMFYPLTSLGVTAHEVSHGFTDTHSHIDYSKPQMGALHESFSDMAAIAAENYLTGKNGWDIGREIMKGEGALRYLDNPPRDGMSIDNMKDFDATEPHLGAGITNKAFYLLATTKGWNTRKAFDVMVKANMHYWTSSMSTFADAACGVVSATKDYGYNVADVRIAFAKVGVDTDQCE